MENTKQKAKVGASHLLVKTLEEAQELKNRVEEGEEFEKLAKEHSLCPSGQAGGELGLFGRGQMVPEFEKACFEMAKDQVSDPVKTQFGWHLIKVTDIVYKN